MSTFFRLLAALLLVAVVVGIGAAVYNSGVSAGLTEAAVQAASSGDPTPVVPYGYGYGPYWHGPFGFGWGIFGIFFWILGIFLIIGLIRAVFGFGRGGGGHRGHGGWGGRYERMDELHRELHRRESGEGEQRPAGA